MAWKRLTFILIPHHRGTIRQVGVPRPIIYGVIVFLVAAIGVMGFYIMGFKGKAFYAGRTRELNAQNAVLEEKLARFDSLLGDMTARVAALDSINRAILAESRISNRDLKTIGGKNRYAVGGDARINSQRMIQIVDRLDRDSRVFEDRFNQLYEACMSNKDFLRRIPSIRPADGFILKEFGRSVDELTGREKLHEGVNINNVVGTPVVATADGVVKEVKLNATDENGIYVVIDHENGYETTYTHLTPQVLVRQGDRVARGAQIGSIGQTGISIVAVAPHILYKVSLRGKYVDPALYDFAREFSERGESETVPSPTASPRS